MSEKIELTFGFIEFHAVEDFADIHNIEVKAGYRQQGYGTKLMALFLNEMQMRNVIDVTLEVRIDNVAAIKLYEKFDFKKVNIRKGYYDGIDGILMKRSSVAL